MRPRVVGVDAVVDRFGEELDELAAKTDEAQRARWRLSLFGILSAASCWITN
jgi:hypothetical protein